MTFIANEEIELKVEATLRVSGRYDIEPFQRGRYSGPPESCFPDEGGYATLLSAKLPGLPITLDREQLVLMLGEEVVSEMETDAYERHSDEQEAAAEDYAEWRAER